MKEDNNGSGSVLTDDGTENDEPPKRECRFPSRNSFFNIERVELDPPLRNLLLR